MTGLYNTDGQRQVNVITPSSYTGLYAADGTYNGVTNDGTSTYKGTYHPSGALNVAITTDPFASAYSLNGSSNIIASSNGYALLGTVGASSFAPSPAPAGYHWEFLTETGQSLTEGQPLVELVRN